MGKVLKPVEKTFNIQWRLHVQEKMVFMEQPSVYHVHPHAGVAIDLAANDHPDWTQVDWRGLGKEYITAGKYQPVMEVAG